MHRHRGALGWLVPVMGLAFACSQGCGSDTPGAPPGPSPPAPVATAAFVHVLAPPQVTASVEQAMLSTFAVTPPTGALRSSASLVIDGARRLAADSSGRLVYVAGIRRQPGYLRSYSVEGSSGALVPRSEVSPLTSGSTPFVVNPVALAANERQVWLSRESQSVAIFDVEPLTGVLSEGSPPSYDFLSDPLWFVLPPSSPVVYVDEAYLNRGIVVLSPRDDGRLVAIGTASLPGNRAAFEAALTAGCFLAVWRTAAPGTVAAGGIASFQVAPVTGLLSSADAVTGFTPVHLAAGAGGRVAVTTSTELRTYSLSPTCQLAATDTVATSASGSVSDGSAGSIAFHPSGRFLYVDQDGGLQNYAILDNERLRSLETVTGVRGRILVTPPPP
jgi:hypothetical protein